MIKGYVALVNPELIGCELAAFIFVTLAHFRAIPAASRLFEEVRIFTYSENKIPSWKEVKHFLSEKPTKVLKFTIPQNRHAQNSGADEINRLALQY